MVSNQATCVVVGSWNTAILNPKWLAKNIFLLPEDAVFDVEVAVDGNIGIRTKISDLYIAPTVNRLTIYPASENTELFKLIDIVTSRLFEKLPYTPINAIGHNFVYQLDDVESFKIDILRNLDIFNSIYNSIDGKFANDSLVRHSLSLKNDNKVTLNVSYKITGEKKLLDLNYHYQANQDSEVIAYALNRCYLNYEHSKMIKEHLIKRG